MNKIKLLLVNIFSLLLCLSITLVFLITGAQLAIYGDMNYYRLEYHKYDVTNDMNMEMDDVVYVSDEMMKYLIDKRENLDIYTLVDGNYREFFSNDEKIHMKDVKNIFMSALMLRNISLLYIIFYTLLVIIFRIKNGTKVYVNILKKLIKSFKIFWGIFLAVSLLIVAYACIDFDNAFTLFHQIMFTNDLWLMDPNVSLLINMLPIEFFMDMAFRILCFTMIPYFVLDVIILLIANKFIIKSKNVQFVYKK